MINILKNTANTVVLTLSERVTLISPYFLFELKNVQTMVHYYFIAADTSSYTYRYNKFTITEKSNNPNHLAGEIFLPNLGEYDYTVYEQTSSTNLDPAGLNILETGKVMVSENGTDPVIYEPAETNLTYGE